MPTALRPNRKRLTRIGRLLAGLLVLAWANAYSVEETLEQASDLHAENPKAALALLSSRIDELAPADQPDELARLLRLRAKFAREQGDFEQAVADAAQFQRLAEAMGDPVTTARALFLLGTIEAETGNVPGALEHFHAARRMLENTGAHAELARVNNAIGVAHNFGFNYKRARPYYQQALELARTAGDEALETTALGNLALVASELDGPEAGLELHRQALELAELRGDTAMAGYQLGNICSRLIQADRPVEADATCTEAVSRLEQLGHARVLAGTRMSLGELRMSQGRLDEAADHFRQALELIQDKVPTVEQAVLENLAELQAQRGDPGAALDYARRAIALREQAMEVERASMIEELEVRYQVGQHEREIEMLQLDSQLQAASLHQRNLMLLAAAVALVLTTLLALAAVRGYRIKSKFQDQLAGRNRELKKALRTINRLAHEDPLTGLRNRRAFVSFAEREQARSLRQGQTLSLVMADIDHFKQLNDQYGHAAGDQVLKEVTRRLISALRQPDVVCRWGGDEFVILLPDSGPGPAHEVVERIRADMSATPVETDAGPFTVTLSFGIAGVEGDLDAVIHAADQAMYVAKRAGRDRVEVSFGDSPTSMSCA